MGWYQWLVVGLNPEFGAKYVVVNFHSVVLKVVMSPNVLATSVCQVWF